MHTKSCTIPAGNWFRLGLDMSLSRKFVLEPHFFKVLAGLALPIALQDLIKFSLALADNIMVGSLSEAALGAVTLAGQPFFIFSLLSFGIASGGGVLVAQYYGKHDAESIQKIVSITLGIGVPVSILFGLATTLFPERVMRIFTDVPELVQIGSEYLQIQGFAYFFYGFSNTAIMLMRSTREVKAALIVNTAAFLLNVFLNWVLIFGHLGFPAMGVRGAALGTVISRAMECLAILLYLRFMERHLNFRFRKLFRFDRALFKDFLRYSIPVAVNETGWSLGVAAQSVILGHLNTTIVAASSIVGTLQQMALVFIFGVAGASAPIIGNLLGSGKNLWEAKRYANTLLLAGFFVGLLMTALLFAFKGQVLSLYAIPEETLSLAKTFISIQCVMILLQSYTSPAIVGILRAGGDTVFTTILDIGSLWLFSIPLGYLAGFKWELSFPLIFLMLRADELVKFPVLVWRIERKRWIRNVTR